MIGLIQKSGYIKPGGGGGSYARYIATRDGVESIEAPAGEGYLAYIAERPRSHGLFSARGVADLEQSMEVLNRHTGPVWTFVYSLRRGDADRLGCGNRGSRRAVGAGRRGPSGLLEQRTLSQFGAGASDGAGGGDENSAEGLLLAGCLPR